MNYPDYESSKLEFKQALPKNEQIINTIIAFCNMHGGKLIIGVDDNRNIIGLPENEAHEIMDRNTRYHLPSRK